MPEAHRALSAKDSLVLLPAYLGTHSVAEAIKTARGQRILWLEILVNEHLDLSTWSSEPAVQQAYQTACRWYTHYRRLLTFLLGRTALPPDLFRADMGIGAVTREMRLGAQRQDHTKSRISSLRSQFEHSHSDSRHIKRCTVTRKVLPYSHDAVSKNAR